MSCIRSGGNPDDILGFIHVKDLLAVGDEHRDEPVDASLVRPVLVVPETAPLRTVLAMMRNSRSHLAVAVDEHGSTSGIVTLEDIAEELVGEIQDEHDRPTHSVTGDNSGRISTPGNIRPDELSHFGVDLPEGEYASIGGLIVHRLGRLPRRGDVVEEGGWRLQVITAERRRVCEVEITPLSDDWSGRPRWLPEGPALARRQPDPTRRRPPPEEKATAGRHLTAIRFCLP